MSRRKTDDLKRLLELVTDGCSFSELRDMTVEEATRQQRTWLDCWVLPIVTRLAAAHDVTKAKRRNNSESRRRRGQGRTK